ncbi:MAG: hypothetical protein IPI31_09635 [Bacteroidetes bacterium]|nr:hypothetical protein [Bacteroidota bacterium]
MNNVTTFIFSDGFKGMFIYDDTIPPVEEGMPDTNGLVQETVVDGIDTVWYLGYDTITTEFEEFKLGILDSIITINLGSTKKQSLKVYSDLQLQVFFKGCKCLTTLLV